MSLSKEQFIKALSASNVLTEKRENFIIALYGFSDQSATPDQLAMALGYSNKVVVNGLIGNLGKSIADLHGIEKESLDDEWWPIVAGSWFSKTGDFHWQMHENLCNAMLDLNIVPSKTDNLAGNYTSEEDYSEGDSNVVNANRYERNRKARQACIAHYGVACQVCGFDFEEVYGPEFGAGYIHVHHLIEISSIGEEYKVDPVADLRPVCPNCHAMLHRRRPAFSIKEFSDLMHSASNGNN